MSDKNHIWVRAETRANEKRVALTPSDAAKLISKNNLISVEDSDQRIFEADEYRSAGCEIVSPGSWVKASSDAWILGLKELPEDTGPLSHRHIYFAHAFKGQPGSESILQRFHEGGGKLFDLEFLIDENGSRVVAFSYWAGYIGASLAILEWYNKLESLTTMTKGDLHDKFSSLTLGDNPKILIIGALGMSGRGARDALNKAGLTATLWDIEETKTLDRESLLKHDILINTVSMVGPSDPFVTELDLSFPKRNLNLIVDVTCDVGGSAHCLPVYNSLTSWSNPVQSIPVSGGFPLRVIAIDNLPSLLPRDSSVDFSANLLPYLEGIGVSKPWHKAFNSFRTASLNI